MPMGYGRRPPANPAFRGHRWFQRVGITPRQLAIESGIRHQELSYWMNGDRWTPREFVRYFWVVTEGEIGLADWPKVRDRVTGERWKNGKLVWPGSYRSPVPEVARRSG